MMYPKGSMFVLGARSLGLEIVGFSGVEAIATCPECTKEKHLYLNGAKGIFNCKRCGFSGGFSELIGVLFKRAAEECQDVDRKNIAKDRGLPLGAFEDHEIGVLDGKYLLPVRNFNKTMTDIRQYQPGEKSKSTAGCKVGLYGAQRLADRSRASEPVYICEGEWDAIAFEWLRRKAGKPGIVVGVPGANTFKPEWAAWLRDRDVFALYDNDEAGTAGHRKLFKSIGRIARSLQIHLWPDGSVEGADIRDLVTEALTKNEA